MATKPTTKEKLLKLINSCIENKNFYDINNINISLLDIPNYSVNAINDYSRKRNVSYDERQNFKGIHLHGKRKLNVFHHYCLLDKTDQTYSYNQDNYINSKLRDKERDFSDQRKDIDIGTFHINFDGQPPIIITLSETNSNNISDKFTIELPDFGSKKLFSFLKPKKEIIFLPAVIVESLYVHTVHITFGLLEAEITLEELDGLWNKIRDNYKGFLIQLDEEKLNKHLRTFKPLNK